MQVLIFTAHVNRLPGFYVWNVIIPMSMLSLAGFLQFEVGALLALSPRTSPRRTAPLELTQVYAHTSVHTQVAKEDVADRASISLTLLLTAVAYKLVTAGMVPQPVLKAPPRNRISPEFDDRMPACRPSTRVNASNAMRRPEVRTLPVQRAQAPLGVPVRDTKRP